MNKVLAKRFARENIHEDLNIKRELIVEIREKDDLIIKTHESPIIDPNLLKQKLLEKIEPKPKIIMEQNENKTEVAELFHFVSIDEFVFWYEKNKNSFSENQQKPLNTLVDSRNMTLGGCNCNRQHRRNMANAYFNDFWLKNKDTDLLPTLQKILNTKKIIFGDFLTYP